MEYDATRKALYTPQAGDPVADFSTAWPLEAVCAELSRLAYYHFEDKDGPRLDAILAKAGFSGHVRFLATERDAQAFGTTAPDGSVFIAFRGTEAGKILDLVADAEARLVSLDDGRRVHEGFLATYRSLAEAIGKWPAAAHARRLVLTGHSLGAAMATVMAALREEAVLVTFGSPRVGDAAFVQSFAGRTVERYVDCTDIVTSVPPGILDYGHLDGERYIDHRGIVHPTRPAPDTVAEDHRIARFLYLKKYAWKVWRNVLVRELADHAPINYVSAVLGRRDPD
ncbi:MAG TPA: lipase family protein [Allosphingosinicella sp.]